MQLFLWTLATTFFILLVLILWLMHQVNRPSDPGPVRTRIHDYMMGYQFESYMRNLQMIVSDPRDLEFLATLQARYDSYQDQATLTLDEYNRLTSLFQKGYSHPDNHSAT